MSLNSIVVCVIALAAFWGLTQPLEFRETRWRKITISLPILFLVLYGMNQPLRSAATRSIVLGIVTLGFLWRENLAAVVGGGVSNFLYGDTNLSTGIRPYYRYAKNHRRDEEWPEALAATKRELEKDPKNFEGLMLLAGIYQDLNDPSQAVAALSCIIGNPDATPEQRAVAEEEHAKCLQMQEQLQREGISPTRAE